MEHEGVDGELAEAGVGEVGGQGVHVRCCLIGGDHDVLVVPWII
jgi:hypothetical protein